MATATAEAAEAHEHNTNSTATDRWGPYSGAGDFLGSMAVILACLLAAFALLGALVAAFRYLLRRHRRRRLQRRADEGRAPEKPPPAMEEPPQMPLALVYSAGTSKLEECAICLAEFADGDAVRAMAACAHVFHARCIDRWLAAAGRRPSCPTCRAPAGAAAGAPPAPPSSSLA